MSQYERYSLVLDMVNAVAAIFIPIILALLAVFLHRYTTSIEHRLKVERESIARKNMRYEELSALANDIYCFTVLVGHYLAICPPGAIERKRNFESIMFATLPIWDEQLIRAAQSFIAACYVTKGGPGQQIRLASDRNRQKKEWLEGWQEEWEVMFLPDEERLLWISERFGEVKSYRNDVVKPRYATFLAALSATIGGGLSEVAAMKMLNEDSI